MLKNFETLDLGLIDYNEAFSIQQDLVQKRQDNESLDTIVFCRHPSVVTLGRSSQKEDLLEWEGPLIETNRGGRATYHGEGQLVIYPIVKIKDNPNCLFPSQDVRAYLEFLEDWIIKTLKGFDLKAQAKSSVPLQAGQLNRGVWVEDFKVASIGIAVKKWVTMHGVALNLKKDPLAFTGIKACGFDSGRYASLEDFGVCKTYEDVKNSFIKNLRF